MLYCSEKAHLPQENKYSREQNGPLIDGGPERRCLYLEPAQEEACVQGSTSGPGKVQP